MSITDTHPYRIRGHTLLCLQGFRGEGYSPEFIANMNEIHLDLQKNPDTLIEPIIGPDVFCHSCPHFKGGCTLRNEHSEAEMCAQDQEVLLRLEITPNQIIVWKQVLERIALKIKGSQLTQICGNCPWLPLGYCAFGIDSLAKPTSR